MKIAVLSDLHLSAPAGASVFKHRLEDFLEHLSGLEATHDLIVLGGDIFDHNVGPHFPSRAANLKAAQEAWAPLVERLQRPQYQWILGNNDALLSREGVGEEFTLYHSNTGLKVLHGHRFSVFERTVDPWKFPIKSFASWSIQQGPALVGKALFALNDGLTQPSETSTRPSSAEKGARRLLQERDDLHIVICGHDHRIKVEHTPYGIYANSGTSAFGRLDWLSVDMETRSVRVNQA